MAGRGGRIVGTFQLVFFSGLSHRATRRPQGESVRMASDLCGQAVGAAMLVEAKRRPVGAGCGLIQLTSHASLERTRGFHGRLGYAASHEGFEAML